MIRESDFVEWSTGICFYHGHSRYAQFPGEHVFAAMYDFNYGLRDLLDCLSGGDNEAIDASHEIQAMADRGEIWLAYNDNPATAMQELYDKIRNYYFNVLNK